MDARKRWIVTSPHPDAGALAGRLKVSPIIAQLLLNRGAAEAEQGHAFLSPTLAQLHSPLGLAGMARAAERAASAIRAGEKIVIYGDYDVDGITATSILWHTIRALGGVVDYYIPHRIEEGYGLNADAVARLCDEGARLIITVDCGVTAIDPAKIAASRGVDLIVTDHHEWKDHPATDDDDTDAEPTPLLPDCHAIVHPRLRGDAGAYPNPDLCGAGVAYKLAWGIGMVMSGSSRVSDPMRRALLDATALAALGTIADVVPLVGENRALAHAGLGGLEKSRLVGIRALIASASLTGRSLSSFDVGFKLAPRLNASGRLGHARLAVEMLTTASEDRAAEIAGFLETQNRERQAVEKKILEQALAQIEELKLIERDQRAIVLGGADWHAGVIGIVASRIVDLYHRPAVIVSLGADHGQGSGRSIAGFHLAQALSACAGCLESSGGHEMAAGLKIRSDRFEAFRELFCAHAAERLRPEQLVGELEIDAEVELRQVTEPLVVDLHRLAPFGRGNHRPVLCARGAAVAFPPRRVGRTGEHLQLHVRQGDTSFKCIAFGRGALEPELSRGTPVDLVFEPSINEYRGQRSVELEIRDVRSPMTK